MNLYHLEPRAPKRKPWDPWYDKCFGFVIRAETESQARLMASVQSGDEDGLMSKEEKKKDSVWLAPHLTVCHEIAYNVSGKEDTIIRDFHAA